MVWQLVGSTVACLELESRLVDGTLTLTRNGSHVTVRQTFPIIIICTLFTKYWNKVCKLPKFTTQVVSQICKKGY